MRLPRIVIAGSFFAAAIFLTVVSLRSSHSSPAPSSNQRSGFDSFFSFRAPFSLFPPNAIITLTHENSTAFLARPAAFGPPLPQEGLNGRVWIGSGFGDDAIHVGTAGELGCSDVPGLSSYGKLSGAASGASGAGTSSPAAAKFDRRSIENTFDSTRDTLDDTPLGKKGASATVSDGTDDYLNDPLSGSRTNDLTPAGGNRNHADIQSIQESAEIAGKIVLLSRGGCGFLEKVMWAQRRGAIALIVGDDIKGGPLIQMYARGDTSNVTIPSIFTSRTTAHLLSSLVGAGNFIEDAVDEKGNPMLKVLHTDRPRKGGKKSTAQSTSSTSSQAAKATSATRPASKIPKYRSPTKKNPAAKAKPGWFKSLFFGSSQDEAAQPKSGKLDWVLVEDWKDGESEPNKKGSTTEKAQGSSADDDFIIGVQDWRDPDLVGRPTEKSTKDGAEEKSKDSSRKPGKAHVVQDLPGATSKSTNAKDSSKADAELGNSKDQDEDADRKGIFDTIFGDDNEDASAEGTPSSHLHVYEESGKTAGDDEYDGLWVTLTPTSGASPFLDTILVLVVSPLITLTVVYALLLVRSRIRRRRWRAPKSVVEQLPVRTYQTIQTSGTQSPRMPSPSSSSAATPLLQQSPAIRPRPRSRTTTGIPEPGELTRTGSSPLQVPTPVGGSGSHEHEKPSGISPEWKKYMGRQVECVVCLEEYVDGVSQVMSLPCGHEFHADCITPWLVTRRRTCPICKGDVVRSLARGSPSSPRYEPYVDDSDDEVQAQAAETVNESSSSSLPIPRGVPNDDDLEAGLESPTPTRRRRGERSNWASLLPSSLRSLSRSPQPPQGDPDRDR